MATPARVRVDGADAPEGVDPDGGNSAWERAHALTRLARQRATLDAEEGRCLLAAFRAATHVHLGFAGFYEYIEHLFGYSVRWTQEKLLVAAALHELPALEHALAAGDLSWSAVRELTRVVNAETEHEWLDFARGKTVRQLEQVIARAETGSVARDRQRSGVMTPTRFEAASPPRIARVKERL